MFLNNLFSIQHEQYIDGHAEFAIALHADHDIYKGHFPEDPITPGVCIVQIAVDLFSHIQRKEFSLTQAKNIKFLNLIKPAEHHTISYVLDWEALDEARYKLKVVISAPETLFAKISLTVEANTK